MKKNFMKGMTMLFASMAFVACSHDLSVNEDYASENLKAQYKANFEKKYGKIDPNQSWDFTNYSDASQARTRGTSSVSWSRISVVNGFWSFIDVDAPKVKSSVAGADVLSWNPTLSVDLYPCYAHGKGVNKDQYFHLAIVDKNKNDYKYSNIPYIDVIGNIKTKDAKWYGAGNALIHDSGRKIDAMNIVAENKIWVAYFTWVDNYSSATKKENTDNLKNIQSFEIKNYKEIVVNDHIYWCFDCNKDNDYSDLICLVDNLEQPAPIVKRYLIEDLGSTDDFDFNDIVVDVIENPNGSQKAQVRAMGGTLDFTLKIGKTSWTKEGSKVRVTVDGDLQDTNPAQMYNTLAPIYELVLSEFTVEGWHPDQNDITVYVKDKQNGNVITEIPFPREGDAPMIIAVKPLTYWNIEREELRKDWWQYPPAAETVEYLDD